MWTASLFFDGLKKRRAIALVPHFGNLNKIALPNRDKKIEMLMGVTLGTDGKGLGYLCNLLDLLEALPLDFATLIHKHEKKSSTHFSGRLFVRRLKAATENQEEKNGRLQSCSPCKRLPTVPEKIHLRRVAHPNVNGVSKRRRQMPSRCMDRGHMHAYAVDMSKTVDETCGEDTPNARNCGAFRAPNPWHIRQQEEKP